MVRWYQFYHSRDDIIVTSERGTIMISSREWYNWYHQANHVITCLLHTCAFIRLQTRKTYTRTLSECVFHRVTSERYCIYQQQKNKLKVTIKTVFLVVLPFPFSSKRFIPIKLNTMFKPCVRHLECFERNKKRYQGQKTIPGTKNDIRVTYRFYVLLLSTW